MSIIQLDIYAMQLTFFSKLLKFFHDYCLLNMSVQLISRGKCLQLLLIEKLQKHSFALRHDHEAVLSRRGVTQITKFGLNVHKRSLHDCKIPQPRKT